MAETASRPPQTVKAAGQLLPFLANDRNAAEVSGRPVACTVLVPA